MNPNGPAYAEVARKLLVALLWLALAWPVAQTAAGVFRAVEADIRDPLRCPGLDARR